MVSLRRPGALLAPRRGNPPRALCGFDKDVTKSPFELGVNEMGEILISTPAIPTSAEREETREREMREQNSDTLNIKVVDQQGTEVYFKCKSWTRLEKVRTQGRKQNTRAPALQPATLLTTRARARRMAADARLRAAQRLPGQPAPLPV